MWWWILGGWLASVAVVVVVERISRRFGSNLWCDDDQILSAITYGIIILLAPIGVLIIAGIAVMAAVERVRRSPAPGPADLFAGPENQWIDKAPDTFIADLVRLRQTCDPRLKGENIGSWLQWQFWYTPEAMILDVVTKYSALHAAGVADSLIWQRLEAHRRESGEGILPSPCNLGTYVDYRLSLEDAGYLDLERDFIREQIVICERYDCHRSQLYAKAAWPPLDWIGMQLSLTDFEREGSGPNPTECGAPAIFSRGGDRTRSDLKDLKFLILPGDELWTFSSPKKHWANLIGRGGIVLMRNNRPVAHVVTRMN
jgi:hypothetical protein